MIPNIGAWDPALLPPYQKREASDFLPLPSDVILDLVARRFHTSVGEIRGGARNQHLVLVRYVAMYLIREGCQDLSFPDIGAIFLRDHSTVIHGCNYIRRRMEASPQFAAQIEALKAEVRS